MECLATLKTLKFIAEFDYIVICSPQDDENEDDEEVLGVITCLTSVIQKYSMKLGKQFKELFTGLQSEIVEIRA